jgi:hypothetical protein
VSIVLLSGLSLLVGFLLIALISRTAPARTAAELPGENWVSRITPQEFARLLAMLFAEMKFDIETSNLRGGDVDLFAVNPTPITGARIYVRGVIHPPLGLVGEDEVRIALETARAEMAGKAVVVTPGSFTADARASARGAPVDLLDGGSLLNLVKKHLPQVFAQQHL